MMDFDAMMMMIMVTFVLYFAIMVLVLFFCFQGRMKISSPKFVTDGYFSADGTEQDMTRAV